jgi:hypothetical protein
MGKNSFWLNQNKIRLLMEEKYIRVDEVNDNFRGSGRLLSVQ